MKPRHTHLSGNRTLRQFVRQAASVFALCCIIIGFPAGVAGQTDSTSDGQYAISVWKSEDEQGLPQNTIRSILLSHDGYVWIATFSGLARFDGVKFTVFSTGNSPRLKNDLINQIFEDSRGRIWVGHDTGDVELFDRGTFSPVPVPAEWLGQSVRSFAEDATGRIWILNRLGWILPVDGLKPQPILKSYHIADCLIRDQLGRIWTRDTATNGRCVFQTINAATVQTTPSLSIKAWAFASRKGGIWVAGPGKLGRWDDGKWQEDRTEFPSLFMIQPTLLETHDGRLIAGNFKEGLYILETDGTMNHLTAATGLANDWVNCLCEDRENDLWVGTAGGGLNMLRPKLVETPTPKDQWQGKAVLSVTPTDDGGLWITTEGAGVYRWQNGQVSPIPQNADLPRTAFWSVLQIPKGPTWFGSQGHGLFILKDGEIQSVPLTGVSKHVGCLYADRSGRVWVGTKGGLGYFEQAEWTKLNAPADLSRPDVRCITETIDGSIWFGTMGAGLCQLQGQRATRFTTTNGLTSEYIWALWESPDKALWIGTVGGGLVRLKSGKFSVVTRKQGLPSDVVCNIQDDANGNLWISSDRGIYRVSAHELNACADGKTPFVNSLLYVRSDGLITRDMAGGSQPSGCRMEDGRLCFASHSGVAILNPSDAPPYRLAPIVIIEDLFVEGKQVQIRGNSRTTVSGASSSGSATLEKVVLPPGERRIELSYTGLNFAAPRRVHFRYQMEGLDKDWIDAGFRRSVDYSYLPPGDYRFHVIACNSDGVWNTEGAALAFTVLPNFWQTWWFSTSCWLAGSGLLAGSVLAVGRRRNRRKLEIVQRQRVLERERTRIAQDIHDELGTGLTRISMFSQSAQAKTKNGRNHDRELNAIFRTVQEMTRSLDEIVWAINPRHDTVESLMVYLANFIEEFFEPTGLEYELIFPSAHTVLSINAEARHDLFLAFKEALNNVVKHAAASRITISLELAQNQFHLIVCDDGRGFDQQHQEGNPSLAGRRITGNGLENMRKRLRDIGGICQIDSVPGEGTRVRFTVPLHV